MMRKTRESLLLAAVSVDRERTIPMKILIQSALVLAALCPSAIAFADAASCNERLETCGVYCNNRYPEGDAARQKKFQACMKKNCQPANFPDECGEKIFEDAAAFKPRYLVHSNGKAFTECQEDEQEQVLRGRKICVNAEGYYYFLAE